MARRTRIKICGIRDVNTALAAVHAGADAIGLVFVEKSPRCVTIEQAREIVRELPAFVQPIALVSDASTDLIYDITDRAGIQTVQLHGHEAPEFVDELNGIESLIKALPFSRDTIGQTLDTWLQVAPRLKAFLWDTPPRSATDLRGGSGHTLDWEGLRECVISNEQAMPVHILAGGLTPENVGQAIRVVQPFAVDVSSGVESSRGVKDVEKIRAFCAAVRAAEQD